MTGLRTKYGEQVFVVTDEHVVATETKTKTQTKTKTETEAGTEAGTAMWEGVPMLVLPAGEENKSLAMVQRIWDFLIENGATRQAVLICIGGGVITDMGGFAAATYKRGIDYVNIPTTLLAMVDAGSGGKTGIDYRGLKNEIGVFRQPRETVIDTRWLSTLPIEEILSGMAEMVKHALIGSAEEWKRMMEIEADEDFAGEAFRERVMASLAIKERIVAADPMEKGVRKALNFGHTIGHAMEEMSGTKTMTQTMTKTTTKTEKGMMRHGYAVMYGMVAEAYLSAKKMGLDKEVVVQLTHYMIENYGRPDGRCKDEERLIELMRHDKKNEAKGEINFTLLRAVGEPVVNQVVSEEEIREAIGYLFSV